MPDTIRSHHIGKARAHLIDRTIAAKQEAIDFLTAGNRDHHKLRDLVEEYIAYQQAADLCSGYVVLDRADVHVSNTARDAAKEPGEQVLYRRA